MERSATINQPPTAIAQGDGEPEAFSLEPQRREKTFYLVGAQSVAKEESIVRNWLQDTPAFGHGPEGETLRAFIAFNRICEATRAPSEPRLEGMKVYDASDSIMALMLAADMLERRGEVCHATFDRDKYGHITGIALSVEAK